MQDFPIFLSIFLTSTATYPAGVFNLSKNIYADYVIEIDVLATLRLSIGWTATVRPNTAKK